MNDQKLIVKHFSSINLNFMNDLNYYFLRNSRIFYTAKLIINRVDGSARTNDCRYKAPSVPSTTIVPPSSYLFKRYHHDRCATAPRIIDYSYNLFLSSLLLYKKWRDSLIDYHKY